MELEQGLERKYQRLRNLMAAGNTDAPHIQVEIADLRKDILGSGHSEAELFARTDPKRFDAPADAVQVPTVQELAERLAVVEEKVAK